MSRSFTTAYQARWTDMDFNQHMRNAAYLGCAEETRMRFLAENGFPMARFRELGFGPNVVEDKLTYKQELGLLEPFKVDASREGDRRPLSGARANGGLRRLLGSPYGD